MKFMCPQAEGRAEMPWRKETCPADITRCPPADSRGCLREGVQVCVYDRYSIRSIERDLRRPVTVWVLDGLPLTVIGCGCHPLTEGSRSVPAAGPRGAQR